MEFNILYGIQSMRSAFLDSAMAAVFNDFVGSKGQMWVILGVILLIIPKTRKTGLCVLISYALAYLIGDSILKNLIARPRPCTLDETVALIVSRPKSFSCPSVHAMLAFASSAAIFHFHKKTGIAALIFAALIGFSRLYFFVHFPTDVLLGAVLGFGIGIGVAIGAEKIMNNIKAKKAQATT